MTTSPHSGTGIPLYDSEHYLYTPQQRPPPQRPQRPPQQPSAPRQRSVDLPDVEQDVPLTGPSDAPGSSVAHHALTHRRYGQPSASPPRTTRRPSHDGSAGGSLLFEGASTPASYSRSPLLAPLSPPPVYDPSPRDPRRTPPYPGRSLSPRLSSTQPPRDTSSNGAPSGRNAAPAQRAAPPLSSSPVYPVIGNARQARRVAARAAQEHGPTERSHTQPIRHHHTLVAPQRRPSTPPSPAPTVAFAHPAPEPAASTVTASDNDGSVDPAPSYISALAAAKRSRDAEYIESRQRRVRRKQYRVDKAERKLEDAKMDVENARICLVEAERDLRQAYAAQEGLGDVAGDEARRLVTPPTVGTTGSSIHAPPRVNAQTLSGFPLIDAINQQPRAFTAAIESIAQVLNIGLDEYPRDPAKFLNNARDIIQINLRVNNREHPANVGRAGPSYRAASVLRTPVSSPKASPALARPNETTLT
ncbi:unnamed protein product [Peniophora sp. CBMAI 1063]|nr:unnamed protein product [Peniophora sp. CBMAI 1063]